MSDIFAKITPRQEVILSVLRGRPDLASSQIQEAVGQDIAAITIKRDLAALTESGHIIQQGAGRGTTYAISTAGLLFAPVDAHDFASKDVDTRGGFTAFNRDLFAGLPAQLFSQAELDVLRGATEAFADRAANVSETIARKELERFVIELSWKSSRIEGNTYTLLDTELLMREGIEAKGHAHEEAVMLLNHKEAFAFVLSHRAEFKKPSRAAIEEVHRLLTAGLGVKAGFRERTVGITGSSYRPLANVHQIREAMDDLSTAIGRASDPYTAGLIALAGLSYVQPYEDGNKRTARLVTNAVLLAHGCSPLSYRSVSEIGYREATMIFYETNSIVPLKEIFFTQYLFAAEQYGLSV